MILTWKYREKCKTPSDINEHLSTLRDYAEQCEHITELGVRTVVSTWAFLAGLWDRGFDFKCSHAGCGYRDGRPCSGCGCIAPPRILISVDIAAPAKHGSTLDDVMAAAAEAQVDFKFIEADDRTISIDPTDLLFIDTWHAYEQLKAELGLHGNKARKFIILHDTTTYGTNGERLDPAGPAPEGLKRAVIEFLIDNPQWKVKEEFTNNNGLTVLCNRKEQWISEVYELLCKSQGAPANAAEKRNLREYAESLASEEAGYFQEGMTPKDAHDEELSCA